MLELLGPTSAGLLVKVSAAWEAPAAGLLLSGATCWAATVRTAGDRWIGRAGSYHTMLQIKRLLTSV